MNQTEFHYAFEITRTIIFEVSYYTLGNNKTPYFTTSASQFNRPKSDWITCGQAQDELLPKGSKARIFYKKWDEKHLKNLTEAEYKELRSDLEVLKEKYNYIVKEQKTFAGTSSGFHFHELKDLSMQPVVKKSVSPTNLSCNQEETFEEEMER